MIPKQLHRWYSAVHERMRPLNDSKFFAGLIVVLLYLSSKLVDVRLSKPMQSYFKNSFSRQVLLFAMIWMPTRDVLAALIVSTVLIFSIDCLMNDESVYCVLPESFTRHHRNLLEVESMTSGSGTSGGTTTTTTAATTGTSAAATTPELQKIDAAIRALEQARSVVMMQASSTEGGGKKTGGDNNTAAPPSVGAAATTTTTTTAATTTAATPPSATAGGYWTNF